MTIDVDMGRKATKQTNKIYMCLLRNTKNCFQLRILSEGLKDPILL